MRDVLSRPWVVVALIAAAAGLYLLPLVLHPLAFPFSPGAAYSDALITHLSNARFVHRAVQTWGQIPLWNPTILSGLPFSADPLSGLPYPPLWLLALFPGALALNFLSWGHIVLGGAGMFLLLRQEGLGRLGALTGGLAFAGMPKLVGHVGLGHLTLVLAVCWSPWVLLAAGRAVEGVGRERWVRRFLLAGFVLGIVFIADPRWFAPMLVMSLAYGAWRWWGTAAVSPRPARRLFGGGLAAILGLVAVAAVLAVPMAEFVGLSTRAALTPAGADTFALPAGRLLGLLVTSPGAWAEWMVSMGSVAVVLGAVGIAASWRRTLFWLTVVSLALVLALGQAFPLGAILSRVPAADLVRVPARWLFLAGMGISALAAYGLAAIDSDQGAARSRIRSGALFAGGVLVAVNLAVGWFSGLRLTLPVGVVLLAVALVWQTGRNPRPVWTVPLLTVLLVLELIWIDFPSIEARPAEVALGQGERLASALSLDPRAGRIFSPSYAVPQEAAAEAGLELADGVHPLQLRRYVDYMGKATGFDPHPYSVTLPPFPSGDPSVDWGPTLDGEALGYLGIDRVASTYPLAAQDLAQEGSVDGVLIYRNLSARPRAWVEPRAGEGGPGIAAVTDVKRTPNEIVVRASGPGLLVLAEPVYPGWRASIDGGEVAIEAYQGLLRSVQLPAGGHEVRFQFLPGSLLAGLAVSLGAAAGAFVLWRRE